MSYDKDMPLLIYYLTYQYIHGLAARGVHYLHRPGPLLQDLGFMALPELGQDKGYLSESIFSSIFISFVLLERKLGEGGFGQVYIGRRISAPCLGDWNPCSNVLVFSKEQLGNWS